MIGLEIIRGAKKADGKDVWEDGKILDPENGKNNTLRLTPIEGGNLSTVTPAEHTSAEKSARLSESRGHRRVV